MSSDISKRMSAETSSDISSKKTLGAEFMPATKLVTLKRADPLFNKYLWGDIRENGQKLRALPIETLNLNSNDEVVTFQIFSKSQIKKPQAFVFVASLIKLKSYILILLPLFFVLAKNYIDNRFYDPFSLSFASIAMLFFYAALNIRNDLNDYISGYDRVNFSFSKKPISLGWISALKASRVSWVLFALAFLFSLPALILEPELDRVVAVVALLFMLGQFFKKNSYKDQSLGEIILFILIGPGVASGYQVALGSGIDTEILAFGVLWSFAVLFLIHINNFSHLLTSSQAKIQNTITRMGFDKTQKFLIIWWSLFFVFWFLFHWFYASSLWTYFTTSLLVFWSIPTLIKINQIRSPIGSDLNLIRKQVYKTFLMMTVLFFVENLWYLGVKIDWTL